MYLYPLNKVNVPFLSLLCNVVSLKDGGGETHESNVFNLPETSGLLATWPGRTILIN